jgi:serine/threonine-protein kinase
MGAVFEARQVDLGRTVALKVLNPEFAEDPDFRARFVREARMLATLDSPHIIQVYDAGEHDGEFYIATQLVNGRDLLQRVRDEGALPAAAALRIVGQMASALADAHDSGVLHRDVKPSNILIRDSRADYFAYLCDFGIARHTDSSHTRTGGVLGTLSYLAPECHAGADATVRSDLYSLGCVLWAALTGSAPYERTSEYQVALAHMQEPIPTYDGDSPAARQINEILRISMAKQPTDRFLSASAMHTALVEAEEAARGLRRVDGAAGIRGTSESDRTQLRTAQPALTDVKAASERGRFGRFSRSSRVLAVWVAAMLVLVALAGTAVALLRQNDAGSTAANREASGAPPTAGPAMPKSKRAEPQGATPSARPRGSASPSTTQSAASAPSTEALPSTDAVTCWDASRAAKAHDCPPPAGRIGLKTVFPSMDDECSPVGAQGVAGKAEAYLCSYGTYVIRYSRWLIGADRHSYLDQSNPGATRPPWEVQGETYGRTWVSYEDSPDEDMKYQWSATYQGNPFSVSVEGIDLTARDEGVQRVEAVPPGRIGLS